LGFRAGIYIGDMVYITMGVESTRRMCVITRGRAKGKRCGNHVPAGPTPVSTSPAFSPQTTNGNDHLIFHQAPYAIFDDLYLHICICRVYYLEAHLQSLRIYKSSCKQMNLHASHSRLYATVRRFNADRSQVHARYSLLRTCNIQHKQA
jgi:hypothetical protein